MKKISLLMVLLLIVLAVSSCNKNTSDDVYGDKADTTAATETKTEAAKETQKATETEKTEEMTKMQMLWWSDGIEGDVMQGVIDDYKAETGVEIELVTVGWDDYSAKLKTMIRGGEAPALIRATEGTIGEFKEYLLPLNDVMDPVEFTNVYYNSEGKAVVLPLDVTSNGLFVNTDLLDKYGVNYPTLGESWTWDDFNTEMSKLEGQDGVAFPGMFDPKAHRFFPMVYQFGGKIWKSPYSETFLLEEPAVTALTTLQEMNTNGMLDPAVWAGSAKPNELFKTGQYGFHMSGNWFVAAYQDLPFNWAVVPMPVGTLEGATRSTILGGKGMCAVKDSGEEEAALAFIEYLAKPENHDKFASGVPFLSPRLAAEIDFGEFDAAYKVFQDEIANTPVENVEDWQMQVFIPGMYPIINSAVEEAMGGEDVTDVLTRLEADLIEKAKEIQ